MNYWKDLLKRLMVVAPNPPKSAPPPVGFVHPRLAKPVKLALRAVNIKESHFFLKNPNFGFGLGGAAASAAIHSRNTPASHVI